MLGEETSATHKYTVLSVLNHDSHKDMYKIKWASIRGAPCEVTWEPANVIAEDVPYLVSKYWKSSSY